MLPTIKAYRRYESNPQTVAKIMRSGATRDVLEGLTRGNSHKFAIHFYETLLSASRLGNAPLFHGGEVAFAMFAAEFAGYNRVDLTQRVTDEIISPGFTLRDPILNILLDGYAKGRDFTAAGRIYALLTEGEKTPDVFAHTTLINAPFQEGAVDDAKALLRKAETLFGGEGKERGSGSLHVATYNAVVHGLLINGRAPNAEAIVDHLRNSTSRPKPDTITYNTLLRHYACKSDATNFVRTLQRLTSLGLEPDSYTYTTIVDTLLQSNRPDAVSRMLDVMEAAKIPANTATYTAIIDCLIRRKGERNIRAALQLVNKIEANGIHANEVTFTSLIAGVTRDQDLPVTVQKQLVEEIMAKMTARGMEPNQVTRNFLLLAALKADDKAGTDQAMQIWRETIADKGSQDHITFRFSMDWRRMRDTTACRRSWSIYTVNLFGQLIPTIGSPISYIYPSYFHYLTMSRFDDSQLSQEKLVRLLPLTRTSPSSEPKPYSDSPDTGQDSALQELEPYKIPLERLKMADTEIGKGGFGTVTLAELASPDDPSNTPITVAVKEIRNDMFVLPLRMAYTPSRMYRGSYEKWSSGPHSGTRISSVSSATI
ncbi:hypothetical protein FRC05_007909 [Tulasnella sp. 425]|nr:hypothetical protein FRC05_007909 [Tulasnella sp. 425]